MSDVAGQNEAGQRLGWSASDVWITIDGYSALTEGERFIWGSNNPELVDVAENPMNGRVRLERGVGGSVAVPHAIGEPFYRTGEEASAGGAGDMMSLIWPGRAEVSDDTNLSDKEIAVEGAARTIFAAKIAGTSNAGFTGDGLDDKTRFVISNVARGAGGGQQLRCYVAQGARVGARATGSVTALPGGKFYIYLDKSAGHGDPELVWEERS